MIFHCSKYTSKVALKLHEYTLRGWVHPADVFVALFASDDFAFWLDREFHPNNRFSIMGHAHGGQTLLASQLDEVLAVPAEAKFGIPGFFGWLEYQDATSSANGQFLLVREGVVFDHDNRKITLIGEFATEELFKDWVSAILLRLGVMGGQKAAYLYQNGSIRFESANVQHSQAEYLGLIAKAQQHIAAGDVYQLCLTNQIRVQGQYDSLATFLRLRTSNPSPFASYIRIGEKTLVSSSPEQFLTATDSWLTTKPIKGTRPRYLDPKLDADSATELRNSPKEQAENLMIVDLMRNDLSKTCLDGSVQVSSLFAIESYATVHQLVSTITGRLAAEFSSFDALLAAFPGGSMTGAPKLRAQQLIAELEQCERGIYSGVAGWIGKDGSLEMAMNIRCLVFENGQVTIGVGGGITSDSDPAAEFAEIQLKAQALLSVLGASVNW